MLFDIGNETADVLAGYHSGNCCDRRPCSGLAVVLPGDETYTYRQTPCAADETKVNRLPRGSYII